MKKLISATLVALMLVPGTVQAEVKTMNVVTKIQLGDEDHVFKYNKNGFVIQTEEDMNWFIDLTYKNSKIASIAPMYYGRINSFTYRKGKLATVNNKAVKKSFKSLTLLNEKLKKVKSPKGHLYTYKLKKPVGKQTENSFLLNNKGQLTHVLAVIGDKPCHYMFRYDKKGYTTYHFALYDNGQKKSTTVEKLKNTYKNGLLTSRKVTATSDHTTYNYNVKLTYKKVRVRNAAVIAKQQKAIINEWPTLALIFAQ